MSQKVFKRRGKGESGFMRAHRMINMLADKVRQNMVKELDKEEEERQEANLVKQLETDRLKIQFKKE